MTSCGTRGATYHSLFRSKAPAWSKPLGLLLPLGLPVTIELRDRQWKVFGWTICQSNSGQCKLGRRVKTPVPLKGRRAILCSLIWETLLEALQDGSLCDIWSTDVRLMLRHCRNPVAKQAHVFTFLHQWQSVVVRASLIISVALLRVCVRTQTRRCGSCRLDAFVESSAATPEMYTASIPISDKDTQPQS